MAVEDCVREILCALSGAVLGAIQSLIAAQRAALEAQVLALRAQLLTLDVATFPIQVARGFANAALAQARGAASLVPLELIAGCADLGDFNVDLVAAVDNVTAELNDIIDDANRLLSFRAELNALVLELERILEAFTEIETVIEECA